MTATCASHVCNFKYSHNHFKNGEKKHKELILEINCTHLDLSKILSQHIINIKDLINEMIYSLFYILSLQNPVCILHLEHFTIQTGHISSAQEPDGAAGYRTACPSSRP